MVVSIKADEGCGGLIGQRHLPGGEPLSIATSTQRKKSADNMDLTPERNTDTNSDHRKGGRRQRKVTTPERKDETLEARTCS